MADAQAVQDRIAEIAGPGFLSLMGDPELRLIMLAASDPNQPWSPTRFQEALYKTKWWRTHSETQRNLALRKGIDPATVAEQSGQLNTRIAMKAQSLGIILSPAEIKYLTEGAMQHGISDANDPTIVNSMIGIARHNPRKGGRLGPGGIRTTEASLNAYAQGQFFRKYGTATLEKWSEWINSGQKTEQDFQAAVAAETTHSMPWMTPLIQGGQTLKDIVGPMQQIVANELELGDPNQVDVMRNPTWRKLLGVRNSKGQMVLPTQSEVIAMARSQPQFWKTANGKQMSNSFAANLLQKFGERSA